jgi:hypothetical protein
MDPVTRKLLRPARNVPQHIVVFGDGYDTYVLHAQAQISEAILTQPSGNGKNPWLRMQFGKCRVEN